MLVRSAGRKFANQSASHRFTDSQRVKEALELGPSESIKVSLTTKEGSRAKRAHQAFLVVREHTGLEAPFPLSLKESGKGTVEIVSLLAPLNRVADCGNLTAFQTQRDLPIQLLTSTQPLQASLIIGSFGTSAGSVTPVFDFVVQQDPNAPAPKYEAPARYGKLAEIHHIFRADPKNPPKFVSAVFTLAVVATVPMLFVAVRWIPFVHAVL